MNIENTVILLDLHHDVEKAAARLLTHFTPRKAAWSPEVTPDLDRLEKALQALQTWRQSHGAERHTRGAVS